jgi:glycosyltransferase involved in cell wall biosynthesis
MRQPRRATSGPRVTVLIPSIGRERYIDQTIRSVRSQTFTDFEVVILDNASSVAAQSVFDAWAAEDDRVRVSRVEPRVPMFHNFDRGIRQARGEYVAFFHDDDVYLSKFLETAVRALDANRSVTFFGSNYSTIDQDNIPRALRSWIRASGPIHGKEYIRRLLRRGRNLVAMQGIVFRVEPLRRAFEKDMSPHFGDFVLLMKLAEQGDVYLSAETGVHVRMHEAQASNIVWSRAIPMRTKILSQYCDDYVRRNPQDRAFMLPLRARVQEMQRIGLLWGWANAADDNEAHACAEAIGSTATDICLRRALDILARSGTRRVLKRLRWQNAARRVAARVGI